METFHVYVVGAVDTSSDAIPKLAENMASRYGLPADDLLGRLSRGRFRVKAGIDSAMADTLKTDLESLGARVHVEAATGASEAVKRGSIPPPNRPTPAPPRASTPPPLQSGLSAAFSENAAADLGALANLDKIALSSIDGKDTGAHASIPSNFEPPGAVMSASIGPAAPPAAADKSKPVKAPKDLPVEMAFAPPDEGAELKVDIAPDEIEHRQRKVEEARKRSTTPPATAAVAPGPAARPTPQPPTRPTPQPPAPVAAQPTGAVVLARPRGKLGPFGEPNVRFAVGIAIAIVLGLLPAHLIASSWERSSYQRIDNKVDAQQKTVETPEDWNALDAFRDRELDEKKSERRNIAMVALLMWAAAGAGIAYVWFRRIPWDKLDAA